MANYCTTSYVVEGGKKDLDSLFETMDRLGKMEKPLVDNGFGPNWLGCLLTDLGEASDDYQCGGAWYNLSHQGNILRFETETAYSPSYDVIDFLQDRFPSLRFYFRAEEPGCELFVKNDRDGKYFPEHYYLNLLSPDCEVDEFKAFNTLEDIYQFISEKAGIPIQTEDDFDRLQSEWEEQGGACYKWEYEIYDCGLVMCYPESEESCLEDTESNLIEEFARNNNARVLVKRITNRDEAVWGFERLAKAYRVGCHYLNFNGLTCGDLGSKLTSLQENDLLLAYNLKLADPLVLDYLKGAVNNFKIVITLSPDPNSQGIEIDLKPFTLVICEE